MGAAAAAALFICYNDVLKSFILIAVAMPGAEELLMPAMPGIGGGAGGGVGIVGFGKAVHVFTSKQQPKRLTIYGSDFRSHDWYAGSHRVSWDSYQNSCICSYPMG